MHALSRKTRNRPRYKFYALSKFGKMSWSYLYLGEIALGQNQKYTSERFMQEIVLAMEEAVLQTSPVFSLLIDETTDVSIIKQMIA